MVIKVLTFALLFIPLISGFPDGATPKACKDMIPKHGRFLPQPVHLSPYTVTQTTNYYGPGDQVIVHVQSPSGTPFKGMMVQAYDAETNSTIGDFSEGTGVKKISACSSITHTDNRDKMSATLVWNAPEYSGFVGFRATLVKQFRTFYVGQLATTQGTY